MKSSSLRMRSVWDTIYKKTRILLYVISFAGYETVVVNYDDDISIKYSILEG